MERLNKAGRDVVDAKIRYRLLGKLKGSLPASGQSPCALVWKAFLLATLLARRDIVTPKLSKVLQSHTGKDAAC